MEPSPAPHEILIRHLGSSSLAGREQRFAAARVRLGRRPDNEAVFDVERDRAVSGHHAELVVEGGRLLVRDLASQNGTFVNDQRLEAPRELAAGDEVRLGVQGPRLTAELTAPAAAGRDGIGEETLQKAVTGLRDDQWRTQRRQKRLMIVGASLLVVAGLAAWRVLAQRADDLATVQIAVQRDLAEARRQLEQVRDRQQRTVDEHLKGVRQELDSLKGSVTGDQARLAELVSEMRERQRAIDELKSSTDLTESQRRDLLAETMTRVQKLQDELATTQTRLRSSGGGEQSWADLAERYRKGVFLCVALDAATGEGGIGTAFCVRKDGLLATNAHVVEMLEKMRAGSWVIQNGTGLRFSIKRLAAHPDFNEVSSPDVGLILLEGVTDPLPELPLASDEEAERLRIGVHLGTLGYPGELAEQYLASQEILTGRMKSAEATFKDGWIGRLLNFKGDRDTPRRSQFIQHSASVTGGTSGSPMFTSDGKVVALNNGGLEMTMQVGRETVGVASAAEIGFAIRVDVLRAFMARHDW